MVINDHSDSTWLRTGLGLRLADELWVNCTQKSFYLPGEVVPTLQDRLEEISIRVHNIALSKIVFFTICFGNNSVFY